jgi:hypothetical protein
MIIKNKFFKNKRLLKIIELYYSLKLIFDYLIFDF